MGLTYFPQMGTREKIVRLLKKFDFLEYQSDEKTQRKYKVSYNMVPGKRPSGPGSRYPYSESHTI